MLPQIMVLLVDPLCETIFTKIAQLYSKEARKTELADHVIQHVVKVGGYDFYC